MAEIRVERRSGGRLWVWILAAVVIAIIAAVLLYYAGYIDLPALAAGSAPLHSPALLMPLAAIPLED